MLARRGEDAAAPESREAPDTSTRTPHAVDSTWSICYKLDLVYLVYLVDSIYLVCSIYLVYFVDLAYSLV